MPMGFSPVFEVLQLSVFQIYRLAFTAQPFLPDLEGAEETLALGEKLQGFHKSFDASFPGAFDTQ